MVSQEGGDAADDFLDNLSFSGHHLLKVWPDLFDIHIAEAGQTGKRLKTKDIVKQGLGRNTPAVQACPPDLIPFDQGDLQSPLSGSNGGDIAPGASTDDGYVEVRTVSQCPRPLILYFG